MRLLPLFVLGISAQTGAPETTTELQYDEYEYGIETTTEAPTTAAPSTAPPTTIGLETVTTEGTASDSDYGMLYDVAPVEGEVSEEVEEENFDIARGARNQVTVNSLVHVQLELLDDGDFKFSWVYDSAHSNYKFEYQELEGNNQNVTDWILFAGTTSGSTVVDGVTSISLTPTGQDKVFRWRITPYVGTTAGHPSEIIGQSRTSSVIHQPGLPYAGYGGFAAQILLPTDFANTNFMTTSASDTTGYVIAVLVQFPAGCPSITVTSDLSPNYVYKDPALTDNHRIYVFHQTAFSSQFSGPVKAFHYYVSGANYGGCDLSDPVNQVTVSVVNSAYLVRTTESVDVAVTDVFPSDYSYPPSTWTHQVQVNLTDLIQNNIQLGVSRAISTPRVDVSTAPCYVKVSVKDEVFSDPMENGHAPGWGYLNTYDSNLYMTNLWADTAGGSNNVTDAIFAALDWNTYMGLHLRNKDEDCATLTTTATATFIELNPAKSLSLAVPIVQG